MRLSKVQECDRSRQLISKDNAEKIEHLELSIRDSLKVLDLLKNPPLPNAKLKASARALHHLS